MLQQALRYVSEVKTSALTLTCSNTWLQRLYSLSEQAGRASTPRSAAAALQPWLPICAATPPVRFLIGTEPPTDVLLYPKSILSTHVASDNTLAGLTQGRQGTSIPHPSERQRARSPTSNASTTQATASSNDSRDMALLRAAAGRGPVPVPQMSRAAAPAALPATPPAAANAPAAPASLQLTAGMVRQWVMGMTADCIFVNKPAGVSVQGPGNTLDTVMQVALKFGVQDEPKLVHRLDQHVSGVMVVGRSADAATWLSACFRSKAQVEDGKGSTREGVPGALDGPFVKRTYWAFVAGGLQMHQTGRITMPVMVEGRLVPAVTSYKVKASKDGVSWLELVPETGRRHQLRIHCARFLRTPIIGDFKYGFNGLNPTQHLSRLPDDWLAHSGARPGSMGAFAGGSGVPPVLLHSRKLIIGTPRKSPAKAVAPLPHYIKQLFWALDWKLPGL